MVTRRASGSIAVIVSLQEPHAGLGDLAVGQADRLGASCAPNITSSFENPNTNASPLSISVTSTSSPSASDSIVASSSPPKPAPRTRTRVAINPTYRGLMPIKSAISSHFQ